MRRLGFLCLISILVGGCATQPVQTESNTTLTKTFLGEKERQALIQRHKSLASLKQWAIIGRMSMQTPDDIWTGKLEWQQFPLNYKILFSTPTGQGAIKIRGDEEHVILETSNGHALIDDNEESLLYDQLGWDLPLDRLRQWILGTSELKQLTKITLDETGNIRQLLYPNWDIQYLRFQNVDAYLLPKKIFIKGRTLKLRLVIDKWVLAHAGS